MQAECLSSVGKKWSREGDARLSRKESYENWLWICVLEFTQMHTDKYLYIV